MQSSKDLGPERLIWMYTQMVRIREFEERVKRTFVEHPGVIRGHTHLADGAEASIVGALATRQAEDLAMPSYRCHGYPIVLGTSLRKMMAEIYGRQRRSLQGFRRFDASRRSRESFSRHFRDHRRQAIAHATGAALTAQVKNTGQIVYCFFGDGSSSKARSTNR